MMLLILGLVVFLSAHSTRIVADGWRTWQIDRLGEQRWKAIFSLVSLLGLALIVWGYGVSRAEPVSLWQPAVWTRHLVAVLMVPACLLYTSRCV